MRTDNWLWGFDQFIQSITTPKEEDEMRMKGYVVTLNVMGKVSIYVTAPDDGEAEEVAYDEIQSEDWNKWDLDFEVTDCELDDDDN